MPGKRGDVSELQPQKLLIVFQPDPQPCPIKGVSRVSHNKHPYLCFWEAE